MECSPSSFGHLLSSLLSNIFSSSCQLMTTVKVALSHSLNYLLMACRTQPCQNRDKKIMHDKNKQFASYSEYDEEFRDICMHKSLPGLSPNFMPRQLLRSRLVRERQLIDVSFSLTVQVVPLHCTRFFAGMQNSVFYQINKLQMKSCLLMQQKHLQTRGRVLL